MVRCKRGFSYGRQSRNVQNEFSQMRAITMTYRRDNPEFKAHLSARADELKAWEKQAVIDSQARHARNRENARLAELAKQPTFTRKVGFIGLGAGLLILGIICNNPVCLFSAVVCGVLTACVGFVPKK